MKKFIFFSTILSIFTESLRFNFFGFEFKIFYFVIILNLIILTYFNKVKFSKGFLIFICLIIISGLTTVIFGYNKLDYFLIQLFFLFIIPIYYNSYFNYTSTNFKDIVTIYCKLSFYLAIIGFVKLPFDLAIGRSLESIMLEPAHYCTIILPAYFITLKDKNYPRYYFIIILLSIIISGSSLGLISLGLSFILNIKKISLANIFFIITTLTILSFITYKVFPPFKLRLDDTVSSIKSRDLSKANLSTYALLSNYFVSINSITDKPLLGNGIGSHAISRKKYLKTIKGIQTFEKIGMRNINEKDAGSLFIRIISELGIVGIICTFFFIFKFYVGNSGNKFTFNSVVSKAILLYFFCKLFREGHYFSPEMYFFVFLYVFNKYNSHKSKNLKLQYA
jgi:hypothetical protein